MLPLRMSLRMSLRAFPACRPFSTARPLQSQLSYQVFGPETDNAAGNPVVFLHGLFGSKQNNRSISRYVRVRASSQC
jgi:pimeloyl-ACP methyl ester carboxylesterase